MSFVQADIVILEAAGRALTVDEITAEALRRRLISTNGKTPAASAGAQLYLELRDNPRTRLVREAKPSPSRARRGSVRWTLKGREAL